ncbi:hypothetical protein GDO78_021789 [Eleutherodactylus coqui]|uniref:Uncharacterized protein n=1 Tax=Eleutherodactylus coqui TaxID=57060 RepID=A0A8J6B494_ELECQ|nr:hypothetical protein GDO78_021789 [Eleutherodactylus coqui]
MVTLSPTQCTHHFGTCRTEMCGVTALVTDLRLPLVKGQDPISSQESRGGNVGNRVSGPPQFHQESPGSRPDAVLVTVLCGVALHFPVTRYPGHDVNERQ